MIHFAFQILKTDGAVSTPPPHQFSSSLPDWLADSGFYRPSPRWNNSSLLAPHLCIHQAFSSPASCHPSPTNFPITTCDSAAELLPLLLLNVSVSCGIIRKRTLLFKTCFLCLLNRLRGGRKILIWLLSSDGRPVSARLRSVCPGEWRWSYLRYSDGPR